MDRALPDLSSLRPAGGKRSTKRDRILSLFLRQQGHLSADDLFDLVRREDAGIGRATVYRTLQWMVEAGIARKVDFGEGRSRFEPSYRHPRHFHLICTRCHTSSEFLSSDVESLMEEIASARRFSPTQTVVQIYGVCEACRTGPGAGHDRRRRRPSSSSRATRSAWRSRPSGAASSSTRGRPARTRDRRGRTVFQKLAAEEREHLSTLEARYRDAGRRGSAARVAADVPLLQGRRERPLRGRRRAAARRRRRSAGAAHRHPLRARLAQVLQAVRRAVRGLRRQADLPRVRRRGARAPRPAHPRIQGAPGAAGTPPIPLIDLHTHTTASDGRCTPEELVARARRRRRHRAERHRPRHPGRVPRRRRGVRRRGRRVRHRHRDHRDQGRSGRARPRLLRRRPRARRCCRSSPSSACGGSIASARCSARLAAAGIALDAEAILRPAFDDRSRAIGRPWIARALVDAGHAASTDEAFERWLSRGRPAFVPRLGAPPEDVVARVHAAGGVASLAHPGLLDRDAWIPAFADAGLDALEAFHTDHDAPATAQVPDDGRTAGAGRLGRLGLPRRQRARRRGAGQRLAAARALRTTARAQARQVRLKPHRSG